MFKKHLGNEKGFTLVEVIIVAIIVAALAAVAIPIYTGYITDSRKNMAANTAGSIASLFSAAKAQSTLTATIVNAGSNTGTMQVSATKSVAIPTGYTCVTTGDASSGNVYCYYTTDGTANASSSYSW